MIQQAYKFVSLSLWHRLMFLELKIANILKSSEWGLEKSESPWEHIFFIAIDVFPAEPLAYQVSMACASNCPR